MSFQDWSPYPLSISCCKLELWNLACCPALLCILLRRLHSDRRAMDSSNGLSLNRTFQPLRAPRSPAWMQGIFMFFLMTQSGDRLCSIFFFFFIPSIFFCISSNIRDIFIKCFKNILRSVFLIFQNSWSLLCVSHKLILY